MHDNIDLRKAPALPGLVFRHFRGESDLAGIVAVHKGREQHDQVDPLSPEQRTPTVEELTHIYAPRNDFDPHHQMLIAEMDGQVIGYQWLRTWAQNEREWVCFHRGHLLPQWRGRGVGVAMLEWAETVLGGAAIQRPEGVSAIYRTGATDTERETITRLEAAGYIVGSRSVELTLDIPERTPEPSFPAGFVLRAPTMREYKRVYFALEEAFSEEWGYVQKTNADFANFIDDPRTDPALWGVAWDGDQVAGVIMCSLLTPDIGIIDDLSVGKAWRRRGLGRALLLHGIQLLRERGVQHVRIFTDAADPFGALTLYQTAGFRVVKNYLRFVKPIEP